jgi:hypothetical protein
MKHSHAANAAIAMAMIGWLSAAYGVLSQLGDPAPWVTATELEVHRRTSIGFMVGGVLMVLGSVWLSGYSFSSARKRAIFAALCSLIPMAGLFITAFGHK